ncbi:MAG TPA: carbamoyltransferase C-terminal domain-containing protein [Casimicrobiaceae bacterium]|nr:carbamoyltransferase C-terminal domain-containing protein [Casimicrobiaceae bacterium]
MQDLPATRAVDDAFNPIAPAFTRIARYVRSREPQRRRSRAHAARAYRLDALCFAGGTALNCSANGERRGGRRGAARRRRSHRREAPRHRAGDRRIARRGQGRRALSGDEASSGRRALGHRSILGDPRTVAMRDGINAKVRKREWFRPLAPIVLLEEARRAISISAGRRRSCSSPHPFAPRWHA